MSIFENKTIWITGASSGIGKELTTQFAKVKCNLILSSRRRNELESLAVNLNLPDENHLILDFDLANLACFPDQVEKAIQKFGRIDYLINNGGFSQRSEALETQEKVEREIFEVNYFAHVALSKLVLPHMIKNNFGHITVMSSIAGKFGFFLRSSYSAAKHALHGYFESLRLENENKGISVLLVCPGKINTEISINAKTGEGFSHHKLDPSHENGISSQSCAIQIIKAMEKNKKEVLIGGKELLAVQIKRFFPALFYKIIRKQSPL